MKYFVCFILMMIGIAGFGQAGKQVLEGSVTYITSQNVYVGFASTKGLTAGDTLYILKENNSIPALLIKDLSSRSCVCIALNSLVFTVGDKIISGEKLVAIDSNAASKNPEPVKPAEVKVDTATSSGSGQQARKQLITGRISVSSNTGFSNVSSTNERMRYTLQLNARNIGNSRLSAESYVSFTHRNNEWKQIKSNIFNGLKIYNLALSYELGKYSHLSLGRKINPNLSTMGAIDGLQYEFRKKEFSAGVIAGSRPDYSDYGFNFNLLQYGAYLGLDHQMGKGSMQNSVAFIEQQNSGKTDRRFAYFQHSNTVVKNLYLYGSLEVDLFIRKIDSISNSSPSLTNLYVSLRYKIGQKLSLSASYSSRKNTIYYETYRLLYTESYVDMIRNSLSSQTQGYFVTANYHTNSRLLFGLSSGYRFQKNDPKPSKNLYGYATYLDMPGLHVSFTLSATLMQSTYLSGNIFGLGISRDFLKGKLYANINVKYAKYLYSSFDATIMQYLGEADLMWRISRKLSLSVDYNTTMEKTVKYGSVYVQLSKSF
ncbi:MAG: hypothetical protein HXX13_08495 [Bacteroidetes bacterium]|nr:hypothetical protein [Bacteroidota bacterium]